MKKVKTIKKIRLSKNVVSELNKKQMTGLLGGCGPDDKDYFVFSADLVL